jgi:hypothetical protein
MRLASPLAVVQLRAYAFADDELQHGRELDHLFCNVLETLARIVDQVDAMNG